MNHLKQRSLALHAGRHKSDINLLLSGIVLANFRSNQVPNLSIFPLLHYALLIFIEVQEPVLLSKEFPFKCSPFDLFVLVHDQVILFKLMTPNHYSFVFMLNALAKLSVTAEPLYLMPLLTLMLPILYPLIMLLVALLPTQRAMLVTADCPSSEVFFGVTY